MSCHNLNCIISEEVYLYHIDLYSYSGDNFDEKCVHECCKNKSDSADSELNRDTAMVQHILTTSRHKKNVKLTIIKIYCFMSNKFCKI